MTWSVYLAWAVGFAMGAGYVWFGWRWARGRAEACVIAPRSDEQTTDGELGQSTRYATTVKDPGAAWAFVMEPPRIFSVVIEGMVEEERCVRCGLQESTHPIRTCDDFIGEWSTP